MVKDMMTKLINRCFDEEKALHINSQREKLYAFDKELVTYTAMYPDFLKWLFGIIVIIFMMVPYQAIQEDMPGIMWIVALFGCFPTLFGFRASVITSDDNVSVTASVYKKLMHLPIDGKVWVCVKMEYVLQFSIKICTIAMIVQSVMSLLIGKEWSWVNLVYPIVVTFVTPMLLSYLNMWNHVKSCETR
ncbi:MAG: hypothetical protein IJ326_13105 [Lachnospiraceae bacterium]|nr:hypothetical protein [Lachnospiraceae bacterium]